MPYSQTLSRHFSLTYAQARTQFLAAAEGRGALQSWVHPQQLGASGEVLAMDVLRLGPASAQRLLVVTSGLHGVEGFCGSGCQLALLHDSDLLARAERAGVALLLVHAVNPYGFSHRCRVNEDGIDLNRNFLDFSQPLPVNAGYAELHPHLLPEAWPPSLAQEEALALAEVRLGSAGWRDALSSGQSSHPDGVFYSGLGPAWSNTTLRQVLREHGAGCDQVGWIDVHTGLGPEGHGEKIFAGRNQAADLARARACWGADVFSPFEGDSCTTVVRGSAAQILDQECPQALPLSLGLEFGTRPFDEVLWAMRLDQWLNRHPDAPASEREAGRQRVRSAFYIDTPEWRGMVTGQTRVAVLQALAALAL
ncbi:M14 family metallopeptidase [Curvibacter sp. RS43]|jgi:hypothetical protein|uniref:M14 family metallopeptidase n=1 Tax=Curvibacter microcysteis TaxID=3026419 RepID=A0ABT5MG81_9BURK|nr:MULTISPECIES: M14 family metallopeptidase [unclassified Curvibacter]MDD0809027.1 M14 family metallopeptidase [Curvibacter sp. RS43]MDD0814096.1 M14 family metallopeptidase [Curvibacter sp. HBC28]